LRNIFTFSAANVRSGFIIGHEPVGGIEALRSGVASYAISDRVARGVRLQMNLDHGGS
jgi:hypothetical protein